MGREWKGMERQIYDIYQKQVYHPKVLHLDVRTKGKLNKDNVRVSIRMINNMMVPLIEGK